MTRTEKERLLLDILPFIRQVTGKLCKRTRMPYEDMLQEACMAVWKSLESDKFDPSISSPLTYFGKCVRWRLVKLFQASILPRRMPEGHYPGSLNVVGADDQELIHLVPEHRRAGTPMEFDEMIAVCRPEDQEILRAIYIEGFTHEELGELFHVSRQRIGQFHHRALTTMRRELRQPVQGRRELR